MSKSRAVSVGDRRAANRLMDLVGLALNEAGIELTDEDRQRVYEAAARWAIEEGYVLTRQVRP